MPIDLNDLRVARGGNPDIIRESEKRRFAKPELVDEIIAMDENWRKLQTQIVGLGKEKRLASQAVGKKKKAGEDATAEQAAAVEIGQRLEATKAEASELEAAMHAKLQLLGNYVHDSVPVSKDEEENRVEKEWGTPLRGDTFQHHHELLYRIGGYEPERGSKVAGHRAYFLTGPGVLLNQALVQYGLSFLVKRSYTPVQPPYFLNKDVMGGVAQLSEFDETLYHVAGEREDKEKYLIATSEQPLCAYHYGDWLQKRELPIRYAGVSTCFRKEAGKSGRDVWGIFRVHQFDKVEQFCITDPESSWDMHEEMLKCAEEFYQSLELPYRVVNIVSGELNNAAAKKYDLEAWFPGFGEYKELVSCSNCTDYQSRAMGIRFGQPADKKDREARKQYVHMLNATLVATTRTICCILENYQTPEGVRVPDVLVPFMGGVTFFPFVRDMPSEAKEGKGAAKAKGGKGGKGGKAKAAAAPAPAAAAASGAGSASAPAPAAAAAAGDEGERKE